MAFFLAVVPDRKLYMQMLAFANKPGLTDEQYYRGFRLFLAIGMTGWLANTPVSAVRPVEDVLTDVVTNEHFWEKGYAKTHSDHFDERLWFCSYIGASKVNSKYMKEKYPEVRGVICMRLFNQDDKQNELESHTVQLYL